MGTPTYTEIIQGIGHCFTEIRRIEAELAHLRSQLGELSLAARVWRDFPELGDRREQPVQGSEHQAIQGSEKAPEEFREKAHSYWNPESTGDWGFVGAGGDIGSGFPFGKFTYQVQRPVHDAGSDESSHSGGVQLEAESGSCGADSRKDF